jgi:hypothetical protein
MRAFIVAVDYADLLRETLPYNRHHFNEVTIITTPTDLATQDLAASYGANIFQTDAFHDNGASFNKWKALEQGLDEFGRHGLIVLMDADVLWPKIIPTFRYKRGFLYTPLRRMMDPVRLPVPPECEWSRYPLHPQQREFAGYTQIFHADDPHLGPPPWHQTNWRHAGGADSFFQAKWASPYKIRPPFEVLHLGPAGVNWMGRASDYLDGTKPEDADDKRKLLYDTIRQRRMSCSRDRYLHEKIVGE